MEQPALGPRRRHIPARDITALQAFFSIFGNIALVPELGTHYVECVNVVSIKRLQEFWARHPKAKPSLSGWYKIVKAAEWTSPQDIRDQFNSVDFVSDNRVIFDVGGNNYRVVARVSYTYKQVLVKFVGTHKEYDDIDPEKV